MKVSILVTTWLFRNETKTKIICPVETTVARKFFGSLEDLRAAHSSADLSFRQEEEEENIILIFYQQSKTG